MCLSFFSCKSYKGRLKSISDDLLFIVEANAG